MPQIFAVDSRTISPDCPDAISCTLPLASASKRQPQSARTFLESGASVGRSVKADKTSALYARLNALNPVFKLQDNAPKNAAPTARLRAQTSTFNIHKMVSAISLNGLIRKEPDMTMTFKTITFGIAALSILSFAPSAYANNGFNKFPSKTTAASAIKAAPHILKPAQEANVVTTKRRVKRVVKPVTKTLSHSVSFAANHGATHKRCGFNKMPAQSGGKSIAMPTFIDKGALTAR